MIRLRLNTLDETTRWTLEAMARLTLDTIARWGGKQDLDPQIRTGVEYIYIYLSD